MRGKAAAGVPIETLDETKPSAVAEARVAATTAVTRWSVDRQRTPSLSRCGDRRDYRLESGNEFFDRMPTEVGNASMLLLRYAWCDRSRGVGTHMTLSFVTRG